MNIIINAFTNDKKRRVDYNRIGNPKGYKLYLSELKFDFPTPDTIGKENNIYSLYYHPDTMPSEYFETGFDLYCIKLDNEIGDFKRKVYKQGEYQDIKTHYLVSGFGLFLEDESRVTLYSAIDGISESPSLSLGQLFSVGKPYKGTTYQDGEMVLETIYTKNE